MRDSSSLSFASMSDANDSLGELTAEQRLRLTEVLDRYLSALEQGRPLAPDELLKQHPDLADALTNYFQSLEDLHDMAAGFGSAAAQPSSAAEALEGTRRIGDFELVREIGRGGMGVVYEARQISLGRRVALKILPFAAVLDARQIARFQHEAQAAAQLHHPHIVPVFAIGVERGVHYYAMQLVNGQSLEELIAGRREERQQRKRVRRGAEEFLSLARLGQQAAEALQAAHDYGIVHRDIKPSNLLLDAAGKLWVTDFGLARMQHDASLTRSGDLIGTLRYMSPEQASGTSGVIDERTDVYALGATLYELATLRPAYAEESSAALLKAIETRDPVPPRQVRPEIPVDLESIIRRAMARQRNDRYATAAELAADLECFAVGRPTKARSATLGERVTRWSQRQARGLMVASGLLAMLVVILTIATLLIASAKQQSREQLARADRYSREAREVLDRFGRQLSERLANVAGAEGVRRDLLLEASDYYRRFIADSETDPARRGELALAYGRLASLLDEVGTNEEALAAHELVVEYLSRVASDNAAPSQQRQLAIARNNLAVAHRRMGNVQRSIDELRQAKTVQQTLEPARNHEVARELATTFVNLGLAYQDADDIPSAADAFHSAVKQLTTARAADPIAPEAARPMAAAYSHLAGIQKEQYPELAAGLYHQAIVLLEPLASAEQDREARLELALCHHRLGTLLTRQNRFSEAISSLTKSADCQQALVEQFPGNARQHSDLGSMLSNLGVAQAGLGDYPAASKSLVQAIEQQRLALSLRPDSARIHDLLRRHEKLRARYQAHLSSNAASNP